VTTAVGNAEQASVWDAQAAAHWLPWERRYDATVAEHERALQEAAAIRSEDRVLDVGCGTGQSTRTAARAASAGTARGVDLSRRMVGRARRRAAEAGLHNALFDIADAQTFRWPGRSVDVVISRFGASFFDDPASAFANIRRAMSRGARLVLIAWAEYARNEWLTGIREALTPGVVASDPPAGAPGPFGLARVDQAHAVLRRAGFNQIDITEVEAGMWFGVDVEDALAFLRGSPPVAGPLQALDERARRGAERRLSDMLTEHVDPDGVRLDSAALLIRARST
jgi:SAM-dependent methyltransferase